MRKMLLAAATAAAFAFAFGTVKAGDLNTGMSPTDPTVIGADTGFFTTGGVADDWSAITIDISGGDVTVGSGAGSTTLEWDVGKMTLTAGRTLTVANSAAAANPGTILNLGTHDVSAGGSVVLSGETGKNVLNVGTLTAGAGAAASVELNSNTLLTVANDAVIGNGTVIDMRGGDASFGGDLSLTSGSVIASSAGNLAVAGTLTADGAAPVDAVISVTGGNALNIVQDLAAPSTLGNVVLGGTGGGTIDLQGGSVLNAGDLTLDTGATLIGSVGDANVFNVANLRVAASFNDTADVATVVSGEAVIDAGMIYTVAGDNNVYNAMTVNGTLSADATANTAITLGKAAPGTLAVDGGVIRADGGFIFSIDNAAIVVTDASGADSVLDSANGELNLSASGLTVATTANKLTIVADSGVSLKTFVLESGAVETDTAGLGKLVVSERAVIGKAGSTAPAEYRVKSDATVFEKGVKLIDNGAITATAAGAIVNVGTATASANIELGGKAKLDGTTAPLTFVDASGLGAGVAVTALGNEALGDIDATGFDLVVNAGLDNSILATRDVALRISDGATGFQANSVTVERGELSLGTTAAVGTLTALVGDVTVKSGGMISSNGLGAAINGAGGVNFFTIQNGGILSAHTADVTINDFDTIRIDGAFTTGYDGGAVTKLVAGANVAGGIVIGSTGSIALTNEAALNIQDNDVIIDSTLSGAVIDFRGQASTSSIFGTFHFGLDAGDMTLILKSTANRIDGSGSDADRALAYDNITREWGRHQIGQDLGNIIYDASVVPPNLTVVPTGSPAGDKNLGIFQALGNSNGKNVGKDTLEYVNGAYLYGVTDVAMETSRAFFSDVAGRAKAVNGQFVAARETMGSVDALASTALNANYANRFWAGGFGLWQDADTRQSFSGYRYDSWGAIMGYDRVVADGLALGVSAAYNKGDYADKGALAHDSNIESYTGGLYGIYSHESGFTSTVFGAYTYSDNDINELRRDPVSGTNAWGKSKFHTKTWSVGGNLGWDFRPTNAFTITPTVGVNYIRAKNSNHSSSLGGVSTQRVVGAKNHGVFLPVELTMQYDIQMGCEGKLRLEAGGGYAYNFNDDSMDGSMNYFDLVNPNGQPVGAAVRTRDNSRHSYKAGGGFRYNYKKFDVGVRYDYMGKTDYKAHRVVGSIGISF